MLLQSNESVSQSLYRLALEPVELPLELPLDLENHLYRRSPIEVKGRAKRQLDFETGRFCAAQGLSKFGLETQVGVGVDRSPVWPSHSIGSISHSDNFCWSAVGQTSQYRSVGIDTEPIADDLSLKHLYEEIITDGEDELAFQLGFDRFQAFTVIFSAKESLYKCVYQIEPEYFGFHEVTVTSIDQNFVDLQLNDDNPNREFAGRSLSISYKVTENDVFTACWLTKKGDVK